MNRTLNKNLKTHLDTTVTISGYVDVIRIQGKVAFFDVRDYTGKIQSVVFSKPDVLAVAETLKPMYAVRVTGIIKARGEKQINPHVPNGDIELEVTDITILSEAEVLPFDLTAELNLDTLLDFRPLTARRERERAIFTIQSEIIQAYGEYLRGEGFTEFQAPKLVGGDAEGGAAVFAVPYFKKKTAYLASSPQFYKQIMVGAFERVFAVATAFRAEKSATTRHLSEYTSLDLEMGFITDHHDIMRVETGLMRHLVQHLSNTCATELATLGVELPLIPTEGDILPHLKLREAQALIKERTGIDKTTEPDLEPEDERWLCEYARTELGSDFIFITHYPVAKRPFYTYEDENDPGYTKSFDLLFRGVEITTGGQRVHDRTLLEEKIKAKGLDPANFSFYLQAFRYGLPPHGGWGMGLERLTQKFCGVANVKEATLFPRDINRIDLLTSQDQSEEAEL